MGMGGGGRRPDFDPVVLDGPPPPERIDSVMTLDTLQKGRYASLYQNFMASTKSERDQIKQARESFRNGGADSDPDARQHSRDSMHGAMQTLEDRQKDFDDTLKEFLTKDQLKHYSDWRKARRKEFEDMRKQRGGDRGNRQPPG
jgi:primase-polymerase (primpol)-like protein